MSRSARLTFQWAWSVKPAELVFARAARIVNRARRKNKALVNDVIYLFVGMPVGFGPGNTNSVLSDLNPLGCCDPKLGPYVADPCDG